MIVLIYLAIVSFLELPLPASQTSQLVWRLLKLEKTLLNIGWFSRTCRMAEAKHMLPLLWIPGGKRNMMGSKSQRDLSSFPMTTYRKEPTAYPMVNAGNLDDLYQC